MAETPSPSVDDFYTEVLSRAEGLGYRRALEVKGIDGEMAVLRTRIRRILEKQPDKVELLLKSVNLLIRAAAVKYRISPESREDLYENLVAVIKGIGQEMLPVDMHETFFGA